MCRDFLREQVAGILQASYWLVQGSLASAVVLWRCMNP